MTMNLPALLAENAAIVETTLASILPRHGQAEAVLFEAMRYGALGGGKRLRPFLVLESAKLFGVRRDCALRVAAAIEFMHSYSLIHDDLPAMDNGLLRHGQPTVHCQFDEATAILAGDALLTLAFEVLANPETHEDPSVRCALVSALARAAGAKGMVAGQMLDLLAPHEKFDIGAITRLQRLKTGELFAFACESGAILGRGSLPHIHALQAFAHDMGLAFQIADDLMDLQSTPEETGKSTGQDEAAGKATFVSILGPERAREQAKILSEQAARHLDVFGDRAETLKAVARFAIDRKR